MIVFPSNSTYPTYRRFLTFGSPELQSVQNVTDSHKKMPAFQAGIFKFSDQSGRYTNLQ
jgi:hypothetical protein